MARRILITIAGGAVSLALCLFLALVLEWPRIFVYMVGLMPMFAVASVWSPNQDSSRQNRRDGQR